MNPYGPYSIGSTHWPGISKLIEEAGEVQQAAAKLIATNGDPDHWDGTNLHHRLEEELGDLLAAATFVATVNPELDTARIYAQREDKLAVFFKWHQGDNEARVAQPTPYPYDPKAILRKSLTQSIEHTGEDRVHFRRPDGTPIKASEMVAMLDRNDPDALAFLEDVTSAALRAVGLHARDKEPK